MTVKKAQRNDSAKLRRLAEERLRENRGTARHPGTGEVPLRLLHELQVHQIELEMQNEELLQARDEREKTEAVLGKYSDLYDFAPVGYFNLDHEGIIRAVNLTGAGFLGVERSLLISRGLDLFISDETRPVFHEFLYKVFASEAKETCEVVFVKERHSPLFVQVEAVVSESGEECRAVVIDITERKLAEEQVRSMALFPGENPSPVLRVARDGTLLEANRAAATLLAQWQCHIEGEAPDFVRRELSAALDLGMIREVETRCGESHFSFMLVPISDRGYVNLYGHDITRSKQAEESLKRAKEEWERTFASVPDLIAILDNQHRVLRVNETMARRLGLKPDECVGLPCYKAVHGLPEPPGFCPHTRTLRDGREHVEEVHEERLGGDFLVSTTLLNDEQGQMIGSVHIAHNITERKRAEEALKKLNEELENRVAERTEELAVTIENLQVETAERLQAMEALREKEQILILQSRQAAMGETLCNIAHQWRQPLNALGLTIQQLALIYDLGEINRELLDQCVNNSMELIKRMSRTIDDFRNYCRPDKEKAEFKVGEAIAITLSLIESSFKNQNIGIEVVEKNDHAIYGYRNEFAQALLNILNNARDALTERDTCDPRVTITIYSEGERAVVTIADNAGGIPEEIIGKIFAPYFTTKGPQAGAGVGLFMSKTIIEKNMGGRLAARNIANGAEFRIEL